VEELVLADTVLVGLHSAVSWQSWATRSGDIWWLGIHP